MWRSVLLFIRYYVCMYYIYGYYCNSVVVFGNIQGVHHVQHFGSIEWIYGVSLHVTSHFDSVLYPPCTGLLAETEQIQSDFISDLLMNVPPESLSISHAHTERVKPPCRPNGWSKTYLWNRDPYTFLCNGQMDELLIGNTLSRREWAGMFLLDIRRHSHSLTCSKSSI